MTKSLPLALLLCLAALLPRANAATPSESLRTAFENLDVPALRLLAPATRMDMADYAAEGKDYKANNKMMGESSITAWSDSNISVRVTEVSRIQLFTLPTPEGYIFGLISTVDSNGADSTLELFSSALRPLKLKKYLTPPLTEDFIAPTYRKDKEARAAVLENLPFPAVEYSWDPSAQELTATLSVEKTVSLEAYKAARPYLVGEPDGHPVLVYRWTGKKFGLKQLIN